MAFYITYIFLSSIETDYFCTLRLGLWKAHSRVFKLVIVYIFESDLTPSSCMVKKVSAVSLFLD